jgi:hypothetical protein
MLVARENEVRITVKILGVLLALFGVLLLAVFPFALGNAIKTSDNGASLAAGVMAVLGIGFLFAGRHFFQADPSVEDNTPPPSNFSRLLVRHRRELSSIAQIGLMLSVIRLIAACFGSAWPPLTTWFLLICAFALDYCGRKAANPAVTDNRDWMTVPAWIRRILEWAQPAVSVLGLGVILLAIYAQWPPGGGHAPAFILRIAFDCLLAFMYALVALFFRYGELQPPAP